MKKKVLILLLTSTFLINGMLLPFNLMINFNYTSSLNSQVHYYSILNDLISKNNKKNHIPFETKQYQIPQNIIINKSEDPYVNFEIIYTENSVTINIILKNNLDKSLSLFELWITVNKSDKAKEFIDLDNTFIFNKTDKIFLSTFEDDFLFTFIIKLREGAEINIGESYLLKLKWIDNDYPLAEFNTDLYNNDLSDDITVDLYFSTRKETLQPFPIIERIFNQKILDLEKNLLQYNISFIISNLMDHDLEKLNFTYIKTQKKDYEGSYEIDITSPFQIPNFETSINEIDNKVFYNLSFDSSQASNKIHSGEWIMIRIIWNGIIKLSNLNNDGVIWNSMELDFSDQLIYHINSPYISLLNPFERSAGIDFDFDGLTNLEEKTNPNLDPYRTDTWLKWDKLCSDFIIPKENIYIPPNANNEIAFFGSVTIFIPLKYLLKSLFLQITELGNDDRLTNFKFLNYTKNFDIIQDLENPITINNPLEIEIINNLTTAVVELNFSLIHYGVTEDSRYKMNFYIKDSKTFEKIKIIDALDLTIQDSDSDGLTDFFETKLAGGNKISFDLDRDWIPDGIDLSPDSKLDIQGDSAKIVLPVRNIQNSSQVTIDIQIQPTNPDYTQTLPYGNDELQIFPGIRIFGSQYGGDFLPDNVISLDEGLTGIMILNPFKGNFGFPISWLGYMNYSSQNLAITDKQIILNFELIWIILKNNTKGDLSLFYIYNNTEQFVIQGFLVTETEKIELHLGLINEGEDHYDTLLNAYTLAYILLGISSNSTENIPNLFLKSKTIHEIALVNPTFDSLINETIVNKNLNKSTSGFIRISSSYYLKYDLSTLLEIRIDNLENIISTSEYINIFSNDLFSFEGLAVVLIQFPNESINFLTQLFFETNKLNLSTQNIEIIDRLFVDTHKYKYVGLFVFEFIIINYNFQTNNNSVFISRNKISSDITAMSLKWDFGTFWGKCFLNMFEIPIRIIGGTIQILETGYHYLKLFWGWLFPNIFQTEVPLEPWQFFLGLGEFLLTLGRTTVNLYIIAAFKGFGEMGVFASLHPTLFSILSGVGKVFAVIGLISGSLSIISGLGSLFYGGDIILSALQIAKGVFLIAASLMVLIPEIYSKIGMVIALVGYFICEFAAVLAQIVTTDIMCDPDIVGSRFYHTNIALNVNTNNGGLGAGDEVGMNLQVTNLGLFSWLFVTLQVKCGDGEWGLEQGITALPFGVTMSITATDYFDIPTPNPELHYRLKIIYWFDPPPIWVLHWVPPFFYLIDIPGSWGTHTLVEDYEVLDTAVCHNNIENLIADVISGEFCPLPLPEVEIENKSTEIYHSIKEYAEYNVKITNPSDVIKNYNITTNLDYSNWRHDFGKDGIYENFTIIRNVQPHSTVTLPLRIYAREDDFPAARDYKCKITVVSTANPNEKRVNITACTVHPFFDMGISFTPQLPPQIDIIPGEIISNNITIQNLGNDNDEYDIEIIGLPENYYNLTGQSYFTEENGEGTVPTDMTADIVKPHNNKTYFLTITPSKDCTIPRSIPFSIRITSKNDSSVIKEYNFILEMGVLHEISIISITDPVPSVFRPGNTTPSTFQITLKNFGNVEENIQYSISVPSIGTDFFPSTSTTTIPPCNFRTTDVSFIVKKHPLLTPGLYSLKVDLIGYSGILNSTQIPLEILEFHDVEAIYPETVTLYDSEWKSIAVKLINMGNVYDNFYLDLSYNLPVENANLSNIQFNLAPGNFETTNLNIFPYCGGNTTIILKISYYDHDQNLVTVTKEIQVIILDDDPNPPEILIKGNLIYGEWIGEGNAFETTVSDGYPASWLKHEIDLQDKGSGIYYYEIYYNDELISSEYPEKYNKIHPRESDSYSFGISDWGICDLTWNFGRGIFEGKNTSPAEFLGYTTFFVKSFNDKITTIDVYANMNGYTDLIDPIIDINNSSDPFLSSYEFLAHYPIPNKKGDYFFQYNIFYEGSSYPKYASQKIKVISNNEYLITEFQIPKIVDNPSTPDVNEGLHYFYIKTIDDDFDNENPLDRAISDLNITVNVVDDDVTPPSITLGKDLIFGVPYAPEIINETYQTIIDSASTLSERLIGWYVTDSGELASVNVTLEIIDEKGVIVYPESIIYQYIYSPYWQTGNIQDYFVLPFIHGTHIIRVYAIDYDIDREGDQLMSTKSYNFTILDDDSTPFSFNNLNINQKIFQGTPIIELTAEVNESGFLTDPYNHKILIFVDGKYIEDVNVTYTFIYTDDTITKIRITAIFENNWLENKEVYTHDVEILLVDNDYDIIEPYYLENGEWAIWDVLESLEDLGLNITIPGFIEVIKDGTLKYIVNCTEDEHPSSLGYGSYHVDAYLNDSTGENVWTMYHTEVPFPLLILNQMFSELWSLSGASSFISRGTEIVHLESIGNITREILNTTILIQLPLNNSSAIRLTAIFDLQTGIATRFTIGLINETVSIAIIDSRLRDTNAFKPYEFNYNNQTINMYIPPDATLFSEFIYFTVGVKPILIFELLENLKEEIKDLNSEDIKFPAEVRKLALLYKIDAITLKLLNYDFEGAIDKVINDLKPKLTEKWILDLGLQSEFTQKCDKILEALNQLEIPDSVLKSDIKNLMLDVNNDLDKLIIEINQIENTFIRCLLSRIIEKALESHSQALYYIDQENFDRTIIMEKITNVKIKLSECFLEIFNYFNVLEKELYENINDRINQIEINLNIILFNLPILKLS